MDAVGRLSNLAEPVHRADSDACPPETVVVKSVRRQRRLKPVEVDDLVVMYKSGMSVNELAAQAKIHRTTVMAHLRRRGVKTRRNVPKLREEHASHVIEQYKAGLPLVEVAADFGVNAESIRQVLIERGVPRRQRGRQRHDD